MDPYERGRSRLAFAFSAAASAATVISAELSRFTVEARPWTAGGAVAIAVGVGAAVFPAARRGARLRRNGGVPCPTGCGATWPALDLGEVFRTRGHFGDLLHGEGAWAWCEGHGPAPRHPVVIEWSIAYAEMVAALDAYRIAANVEATALSASSDAESQVAAAGSRDFAKRASAFLRDGAPSVAGNAIIVQTYRGVIQAYAGAAWPRTDRERLYQLLAAIELWAALR